LPTVNCLLAVRVCGVLTTANSAARATLSRQRRCSGEGGRSEGEETDDPHAGESNRIGFFDRMSGQWALESVCGMAAPWMMAGMIDSSQPHPMQKPDAEHQLLSLKVLNLAHLGQLSRGRCAWRMKRQHKATAVPAGRVGDVHHHQRSESLRQQAHPSHHLAGRCHRQPGTCSGQGLIKPPGSVGLQFCPQRCHPAAGIAPGQHAQDDGMRTNQRPFRLRGGVASCRGSSGSEGTGTSFTSAQAFWNAGSVSRAG